MAAWQHRKVAAMTAARPDPPTEPQRAPSRAARPHAIAPATQDPPAATLRPVDKPPALVVVLAPVVGLLLWAGLIALVI